MGERNLWELEAAARARGYRSICGCDEAGAGPLAGPVYAAAVILPEGLVLPGLDDSKKVAPKRREALRKHFGTVKAIREADVEALAAVVPRTAAEAVWQHFHPAASDAKEP